MSDETRKPSADDDYWKKVETFINLANELAATDGMDSVSSSLLLAAARFSAFNAASKYQDAGSLDTDKDEAIKYFTSIFNRMFRENMDEYVAGFDTYFKQAESH